MAFDINTATAADILARTIGGEARGDGIEGMSAVANVVMNRVARPGWWGKSVKEICLKPYQFSAWDEGDPNRPIITAWDTGFSIYREALDIATRALMGQLPDITNGGTSYYARSMKTLPKWAEGRTPCAEIGGHLFFNDFA